MPRFLDRTNIRYGRLLVVEHKGKDNSVPCCKYCNFAKHTMSEEDFYVWIKRVYEYNFK